MKRLRRKCPDADEYEALLPPRCGDKVYTACLYCVAKWQAAQAARVARVVERKQRRRR